MRRWLREPLLHFVLLGAGLFALDALLRERTVEAGGGDIGRELPTGTFGTPGDEFSSAVRAGRVGQTWICADGG